MLVQRTLFTDTIGLAAFKKKELITHSKLDNSITSEFLSF